MQFQFCFQVNPDWQLAILSVFDSSPVPCPAVQVCLLQLQVGDVNITAGTHCYNFWRTFHLKLQILGLYLGVWSSASFGKLGGIFPGRQCRNFSRIYSATEAMLQDSEISDWSFQRSINVSVSNTNRVSVLEVNIAILIVDFCCRIHPLNRINEYMIYRT